MSRENFAVYGFTQTVGENLLILLALLKLASSYRESFCGLSLLKTAKVSPSKVAIVYNVIIISHDDAHLIYTHS